MIWSILTLWLGVSMSSAELVDSELMCCCMKGPNRSASWACVVWYDTDFDGDVDLKDWATLDAQGWVR